MCEAQSIAKNIQTVTETLAGTSFSPSEPVIRLLEKVTVVLEELRTLQILAETHSGSLNDQINTIDRNIQEADKIFEKIDEFNVFIQNVKSNLDKLERLSNVVDRH